MAEIFFIANDERILTLIDTLRPLVQQRIAFETDIISAMNKLALESPELIFVEDGLEGMHNEEIARRVRTVAGKETAQLVLLSDGCSTFHIDSPYECSLDIDLPPQELSRQILQLLPSRLAPSEFHDPTENFFVHNDDRSDFWLPDLGQDVLKPDAAPAAEPEEEEEEEEEDVHLALLDNGLMGGPELPEPGPSTTINEDEVIDFFVLEGKEDDPEPPANEAASMPEEPEADFAPPPPLPEPPAAAVPPPAATPTDAPAEKKRPPKSLYPTPAQIYRMAPGRCGTPVEEERNQGDRQSALTGKKPFGWAMGVSAVIVVCLAFVVLQWRQGPQQAPPAESTAGKVPSAAPAPPQGAVAPPAPTAAAGHGKLPQFIPAVAPDAGYAAAHPGWELYSDGKLQFRVYREAGNPRAIQVIGEGGAAIPAGLLNSSFKEATGSDLPASGSAREKDGIRTETRKVADGAEIAIYSDSAEGKILGFVLQLPAKTAR